MIKLEHIILTKAEKSSNYFNKLKVVIQANYTKEISSTTPAMNPFTQQKVFRLFEIKGSFDENFLRNLLSGNFSNIINKYQVVHNYFLTRSLVYFSSFNIKDELKYRGLVDTRPNREAIRKEYVSTYDSSWTDILIKNSHPSFEKSEKAFNALIKDVKSKLTELNIGIGRILNYDMIKKFNNLRHVLLNHMGVEVCPYCNRQYITNYNYENEPKSTADVDHFYPKSIFTLFSLSLFNFVPSCQLCNSRFKSHKGIDILFPYEKGFSEDVRFKMMGGSVDSILGHDTEFELTLDVNGLAPHLRKLENSIRMFRHTETYQSHKNTVRELLFKNQAYNRTLQGDLQNLLKDMGLEQLSKRELNLFQFGYTLDPQDFGQRPLSKLVYDIYLQVQKHASYR
ncbi:HNH endonuclease domain-containing protein [Paenibacillus sp. LK1]|uniref:HNH endonuclease domain-containing protein n=1 Tax=Paenibacillus sp. LK1 TaxID=2053014 RepID=UPI000C184347|nr:HNH endonuclease domain-containing protein [Paenibacillus sp. LK1]PIH61110.1 hypothetical protein CS562_01415 [Paenibacillus sp. LK1]